MISTEVGTAGPFGLSAVASKGPIVAVAWGALSFGAVYPWAYYPLCLLCATIGLVGLTVKVHSSVPYKVWAGSVGLIIAVVLQVLPVSLSTITRVSPQTLSALQILDPAIASGNATRHALSIAPSLTLQALAIWTAMLLFGAGLTQIFSAQGASRFARMLGAFGVVLALIGIIQKPIYSGRIYGFWEPEIGVTPFGPFVNRNHFAGWMLMAIPLGLGALFGDIAHRWDRLTPSVTERVLWLSSPAGSKIVLMGAGLMVMTLSTAMTMSRSGIVALAITVVITSVTAVSRLKTWRRRLITVSSLSLLFVFALGWAGVDEISAIFVTTNWAEYGDRRGAWADAWRIAQMFPLSGTGLNTYGVATILYQKHDLLQHYAQAHNDYLQICAEGGLLLTLPIIALFLALGAQIRRRFREERSVTSYWLRVGAVTAMVAIGLQETVDFSLQMPGNAALFAIVCAIAIHTSPSHVGVSRGRV